MRHVSAVTNMTPDQILFELPEVHGICYQTIRFMENGAKLKTNLCGLI